MSTLKKLAISALAVITLVSTSGVASAITLSELQGLSRDELLSLLTQLLAGGTTTTTGGTSSVACTFTRNMYPGVSGADVKCLQQYLNGAGYTVATSGAGAPGSESEYYGSKTQAAVKMWQDAMGLSYGSWGGYFGPSSRAKFTAVAGGTTTGGGTVVVVPSGTGLVVEMASDSPAKRTLGTGTAFNALLKVRLAAGASDVSVTAVTLAKGGFLANTNINGVDVVDSKGVRHGNVVSSINADNTIDIPFSTTPVTVKAGTTETLTFRVNLVAGSHTGTVSLSLSSVSSNASNVSASYPISSATMDIVSGSSSLASSTLDALTTTGSSTLNVDAASLQEITRFRITENSSNEAMDLYSIKLYNYGNADDTDYKDVTLKDQASAVLATAQPSGQYVTFNLASPYRIDKGQTKDFIVEAKLVDGATKTIRLVVYNDYDIDIRGVTTGISLIPGPGTVDTAFPIGETVNTQTIGSGSMSFSRASDSPSSSLAPGATSVVLAKYIARPTGENYELRQISFYVATGTGPGYDLTGTVYVKVNGSTVYSVAASSLSNTAASTVSLSTYPILTAATDNTIEVVGSINSSATSTSSYQVTSFDLIQAKRLVTLDLVDPNVSATNGYSLSVSAAALAATTLLQPTANSVVAGTTDHEIVRFTLNAGSGGEDVKVSRITLTHNGSTTLNTNLGNYRMFMDVDGDGLFTDESALATTASTDSFSAVDGGNDTLQFSLQNHVTIPQNSPKTFSVRADVKAGATATAYHTFNVDANGGVTATGSGTGSSVTATYSGGGQRQTLVAAGQLTLSLLSGSGKSPSTNQVKVVGTDEVTFAFKATALYENMKIKNLRLTATSTNGLLASSTISEIRLYDGDPASSGSLIATESQFDVCANDNYCYVDFTASDNIFSTAVTPTGKEIYVKAKVNNLADKPRWGDSFKFSIASTNHVSSTGVSSASSTPVVTGTPAATGYTHVVPAYVKIEKVSVPDTTPGTSAGITVARFKITNQSTSIPIYLSSTTFSFTNNGGATTTTNFVIYSSAQNGTEADVSGWNSGAGYTAVVGTTGASTTISFATTTFTAAELKIDANSNRYLNVKTTTAVATNNTFEFRVAALGNILFEVDEGEAGVSGNYNGTTNGDVDFVDRIQTLYVDGLPVSDVVTAGG